MAISSRTYKTKGSKTRPAPLGKLFAPFLYVFAKPKNPQNNKTVAKIKPTTFFVIERSNALTFVG
ncbi:hypothetical protein D3C86_1374840 [compost metagenome]